MITPAALLVVLSRLGAAVLAGGLLGLNRELRGKSVGLRICSLVTLGAAMATLVMVRLSSGTAIAAGAAAAPDGAAMSRIVQGVLTGVASSAPASSCATAAATSPG